jgi:hypothetical protein
MNDLILFFAILGVIATMLWLGIGIGAAARYLVQLHADRVAERLAQSRAEA